MKRFPGGSEWRKWDLHVHTPGTGLNNGYVSEGGADPLDTFADILEASDVAVIGITDYWTVERSLATIAHFRTRFPRSEKLLLPNMEVRLQDVVNSAGEEVHAHLIFRESLSADDGLAFMRALRTERTGPGSRKLNAKEVADQNLGDATVVTRGAIDAAYVDVFGKDVPRESMMVITPCGGDGIRPKRGVRRKDHGAAEIDRWCDAIFGRASDADFFLDRDRGAAEELELRPKPVFAGSDAHSFAHLRERLGKTVTGGNDCAVTWIKADLTFEGLLQTLVEPEERVRIQPMRPDFKEPYQVITTVRFSGTNEFPSEITLNPNLVSVIGSRSSGKSALLAYIAHAVDPIATAEQQATADPFATPGPAAGKTWNQVAHIKCQVEWGGDSGGHGQVIYIPQNSLFALSSRPEDITAKIKPVLFRESSEAEALHSRILHEKALANATIRSSVEEWFALEQTILEHQSRRKAMGEREAVESAISVLESTIAAMRVDAALDDGDADEYEAYVDRVTEREIERRQAAEGRVLLSPWTNSDGQVGEMVTASVTTSPRLHDLPVSVREVIGPVIKAAEAAVEAELGRLIVEEDHQLERRAERLRQDDEDDRRENEDLIRKHSANEALEETLGRLSRQRQAVAEIDEADRHLAELVANQQGAASEIEQQLASRRAELATFEEGFAALDPNLDEMRFEAEVGVPSDRLVAGANPTDFRGRSKFVNRDAMSLELNVIRERSTEFIRAVAAGTLQLKSGESKESFVANALALTEDIRLVAHLQGDRIGGFAPSTMTQGKQALFALTLILNETEARWPLLIDQPEDDLDSRSIYDSIVPYLKARKRERQILMVSHNANLVVGADSEQVIVANRHGDDRQNRAGRTFEYLAGSLEYSHRDDKVPYVLEASGTREHACALLDGGEDAFRKRRDKYRV